MLHSALERLVKTRVQNRRTKGGIIFFVGVMSKRPTFNCFDGVSANLTKITWVHACNNLPLLHESLKSDVMMLEADVVLGTVNQSSSVIPIMGHPPENHSDLSLATFLQTVDEYNKAQSNCSQWKGVKLDFKSIEVFKASLDTVQKIAVEAEYPLWINADILPGPINATNTPVNASEFLKNAKIFTKSILSIGWTTNYGAGSASGSYTDKQITAMLDVIESNGVLQEITFPVRAGLAACSPKQMARLLELNEFTTLTIWSSANDPVDVGKLRQVIAMAGLNRTYVDVPQELLQQLHLDNLPVH